MQKCVCLMKKMMEETIRTSSFSGKTYVDGQAAKEALIRSQVLINHLHECLKEQLLGLRVSPLRICPPVGHQKPEMKIVGFFKQKDQDVCVLPQNLRPYPGAVDWGPLQYERRIVDRYGKDYSEATIVINVRSQLSSIAKNTDTLFERTLAEAVNLHMRYPRMVLGEVYLIPVFEYDEQRMKINEVSFVGRSVNLEKYVSFFSAINRRMNEQDGSYKYERVTLLIVDFSQQTPRIFNQTSELKKAWLVSQNFPLELSELSFNHFLQDLIESHHRRFGSEA